MMLFCVEGSFLFPFWVVYSYNGLKITTPCYLRWLLLFFLLEYLWDRVGLGKGIDLVRGRDNDKSSYLALHSDT